MSQRLEDAHGVLLSRDLSPAFGKTNLTRETTQVSYRLLGNYKMYDMHESCTGSFCSERGIGVQDDLRNSARSQRAKESLAQQRRTHARKIRRRSPCGPTSTSSLIAGPANGYWVAQVWPLKMMRR